MSTQESKDARLHISSILDQDRETHVIRSHRKPVNRKPRRVVAVLVLSLMASSASTVNNRPSIESAPVMAEPTVTLELPPELSQRATKAVTRTSRAVTRKAKVVTRVVRTNRAIAFGLAQRGDRYKWGAAGPHRWDCSGLTMKSFAKAGVKLPHYTGALLRKGKKISKRSMQRGDLVFPSRGHVGIYLGGGKMVAASSGKGKVIVQKVYSFYSARRVL